MNEKKVNEEKNTLEKELHCIKRRIEIIVEKEIERAIAENLESILLNNPFSTRESIFKNVQDNINNFKNDSSFSKEYVESFIQELNEFYEYCFEKFDDILNKYIELYYNFKNREENAKMILDDILNIDEVTKGGRK